MICFSCKNDIPDGSIFCSFCGKRQEETRRKPKKRGNGFGTVYKRGQVWQAEVTLGYAFDREKKKAKRIKKTKSGFKTKKDAILALESMRLETDAPKKVTIASAYETWLDTAGKKLSKSRLRSYATVYKYLDDDVKFRDIKNVGLKDLQYQIDKEIVTPNMSAIFKSMLSCVYKTAILSGAVTVNLALYLTPKPVEQSKERETFTPKEIDLMWDAYEKGNAFVGYILLMIYTGMMPGELTALKKSMIDWEGRTIIGCGLKTNKRKNTPIILADCIIPVLMRLCQKAETEKIFPLASRTSFMTLYYRALCDIGCRPLPPYSCRHTTATALARLDVSPTIIKEIMRHTSFQTTTTYIHTSDQAALEAVNKIKT